MGSGGADFMPDSGGDSSRGGKSSGDGGGSGGSSGPGLTQGLEIAVGVALGVVVGMWWDRRHGTAPWGLLIGLLLGCAAGTYLVIKESIRANKD